MCPQIDLQDVARSICSEGGLTLRGFVGGGRFKKVFRAMSENGEEFALKVVEEPALRTFREIRALQRCDHPNIARLFHFGRHNFQGTRFDFMLEEFLAGGTLSEHLEQQGRLDNESTLSIGENLIDAISHLASLQLVHRDIKPDNIMFRERNISPILVDFGIVRDLAATSLTHSWLARGPGTPYFASPEQLSNQKRLIDWRTDQFSLGVVLCFARFGLHPYQHRNEPEFSRFTVERVARRGNRNNSVLTQLHATGLYCLEKMTHVWPVERYRLPENLLEDWRNQG